MDGFGSVRVTSLFHCETGAMNLLINWLGPVELDLASTSAGGPVRVASLSPAKREVKREATKAWQAWPRNQTSSRCLVRSLVWGAPSPGRPNGMSAAMPSCGPTHPPPPGGEALTLGNDSRGRTSGECGWAPSRAQVGARGRHTVLEGSAPAGGGRGEHPKGSAHMGHFPFPREKGSEKGSQKVWEGCAEKPDFLRKSG